MRQNKCIYRGKIIPYLLFITAVHAGYSISPAMIQPAPIIARQIEIMIKTFFDIKQSPYTQKHPGATVQVSGVPCKTTYFRLMILLS